MTVPGKILKEWSNHNFFITKTFSETTLKPIPFKNLGLDRPWTEYDIHHDLTDKGIEKFVADWNALLK
jgi:transaldolase